MSKGKSLSLEKGSGRCGYYPYNHPSVPYPSLRSFRLKGPLEISHLAHVVLDVGEALLLELLGLKPSRFRV